MWFQNIPILPPPPTHTQKVLSFAHHPIENSYFAPYFSLKLLLLPPPHLGIFFDLPWYGYFLKLHIQFQLFCWWDYLKTKRRKGGGCFLLVTRLLHWLYLPSVGNKDDDPERKVVEREDALKFAEQMGIQVFETSAKDNKNVEEVGKLKV